MEAGKPDSSAGEDHVTFAELESSFQRIITDLVNDRSLDSFRSEYERLHDAFEQSHQSNHALIARCRSLNEEIAVNSAKVQGALKLSARDERTIVGLRMEFEKAWRNVELLHARETKSREVIAALRAELEHLSHLAQEGNLFSDISDNLLVSAPDELQRLKKELTTQSAQTASLGREIGRVTADTEALKAASAEEAQANEQLAAGIAEAEAAVAALEGKNESLTQEILKTKPESQKLEAAIADFNDRMAAAQQKIDAKKAELFECQLITMALTSERREIEGRCEKAKLALDLRRRSGQKVRDQKDELTARIDGRIQKVANLRAKLDAVHAAVQQSVADCRDATERKAALAAEVSRMHKRLTDGQATMVRLAREYCRLETGTQSVQRAVDIQFRRNENVRKEIDKVKQHGLGERNRAIACENQRIWLKFDAFGDRRHIGELADGIGESESAAIVFRADVNQAEIETERNRDITAGLEIRLRKIGFATQRKEAQIEELLQICQMESRKLQAVNQETSALKTDLRFLKIAVTLQKEALTKTDDQCMAIHSELCRARIDGATLQRRSQKMARTLLAVLRTNEELENSELKHVHMLGQSNIACTSIRNEMQRTMESIRWGQMEMCKRDREIEVVREKIRLLHDTFRQNSARWQSLNEGIANGEDSLSRAITRAKLLAHNVRVCRRTHAEALRLERMLLLTQTQAKALEDEVKVPICVHRWTLLENANPQLAHLVHLRTDVLDQLSRLLHRTAHLESTRSELQRRVDEHTRKFGAMGRGGLQEMMDACEVQLQGKAKQLRDMMTRSSQEKRKTDSVRADIESAKLEVAQEMEQFYTTKWKEAQVISSFQPIREPSVVLFSGGQEGRPMIPRLKLSGAKVRTKGNSARDTQPVAWVSQTVRVSPALPPLQSAR
jgi:chromosome segregation ATPase